MVMAMAMAKYDGSNNTPSTFAINNLNEISEKTSTTIPEMSLGKTWRGSQIICPYSKW